MFLITSFCFFQSSFIFFSSYPDRFSFNRFNNFAFSTSILSSCFLRKGAFKLRFIFSFSCYLLLLFIVVAIFSNKYLFSRSISVNLSSWRISRLFGFNVNGYHSNSQLVGRMFFSLSLCPSCCRSSYHCFSVRLPRHSPNFIKLLINPLFNKRTNPITNPTALFRPKCTPSI